MGTHRYRVSGVGLVSILALDGLPRWSGPLKQPWRLVTAQRLPVSHPVSTTCQLIQHDDGSLAVSWDRLGSWWIRPRHREVRYALETGVSREAFLDLLLGPVVSLLLTVEGSDPLHGCAVQVGKEALAFLGQPGTGKSTMAAAFVLAGHRLVVDDLLTLQWRGSRPWVMPGYPEIRLWPGSGKRLIPAFSRLPRVVPTASKRRLDPRRFTGGFAHGPVALRAFYELRRARSISRPMILPLPPREAFLVLASNLYNLMFVSPRFLERQFHAFGTLTSRIPVRRFWLPYTVHDPLRLPQVVLDDLAQLA